MARKHVIINMETQPKGLKAVPMSYHISNDTKKDSEDSFCIRMHGDAMEDAGICDGDILVTTRASLPSDGDIVVAALRGKTMIRRYFEVKSGGYLTAENTNYPAIELCQEPESVICGVVKKVIRAIEQDT